LAPWMSSGRIWAQTLSKLRLIFVKPRLQIWPSTTHMDQMTISTQFIIIIWTCQEMMVWMSMELIGSLDVIL
jgi:hypothetical protein